MASIPVTSFSASKIHDHVKSRDKFDGTSDGETPGKVFRYNLFGMDNVLPNYNSKLMNSIWGQYNLYASHAFQKNNEGSYSGSAFLGIPQVRNLWDSLHSHQ
ncbi:hypothetical protein X975_00334, partial [Stegodyphus mimosarum]